MLHKILTYGLVWITCVLLWCFYQLFGLSFWRHPFTAEHPISPNLMKKQTHPNLGHPESEHIVSKCTVLGGEAPLNERFWSRFHSSAQVCNNCQSCDFKPGGLFRRWMCWLQTGVVLCWLLMSRPWSTNDALMWVLRVMWCPDLLCYQPIWLFP